MSAVHGTWDLKALGSQFQRGGETVEINFLASRVAEISIYMRVGINGFGRIGRNYLKALIERHPEIEVAAD